MRASFLLLFALLAFCASYAAAVSDAQNEILPCLPANPDVQQGTQASTLFTVFVSIIFGIGLAVVPIFLYLLLTKRIAAEKSKVIIKHIKHKKHNAKAEVLKTLGQNELKVLGLLEANGGELKRNVLEQDAGLAKSSLAATLKQLERKNIIEINRLSKVHLVKFSDWFRNL